MKGWVEQESITGCCAVRSELKFPLLSLRGHVCENEVNYGRPSKCFKTTHQPYQMSSIGPLLFLSVCPS